MKYRNVELLASESIAVAGTKVVDVNVADPISRISVRVKLTNATTDPVGHPLKALKKIELVDGADVLFSLTGQQAAAHGFYWTKEQPAFMMDYMNVEYCMALADAYFGRRLWDPMYAVDPKKHTNLQLKIEHDKALGGNTPTAGSIEVRADVFDELDVDPKGFMLTKEHYRYTQVANDIKYVDLPTDWPIVLLMFGAHDTTEGPEYNVTHIKLTEDHDKSIILEGDMEDLLLHYSHQFPKWTESFYGYHDAGAAQNFWISPTWERNGALINAENTNGTGSWTLSAGQVLAIILETAGTFSAIVSGHYPFGQFPIFMGDKDTDEDWWNGRHVTSKRFRLTEAAGPDVSELMRVAMTQARQY